MIRPASLYPLGSEVKFVDCYGENPKTGTVTAQNAFSLVVMIAGKAHHLSTSLIVS